MPTPGMLPVRFSDSRLIANSSPVRFEIPSDPRSSLRSWARSLAKIGSATCGAPVKERVTGKPRVFAMAASSVASGISILGSTNGSMPLLGADPDRRATSVPGAGGVGGLTTVGAGVGGSTTATPKPWVSATASTANSSMPSAPKSRSKPEPPLSVSLPVPPRISSRSRAGWLKPGSGGSISSVNGNGVVRPGGAGSKTRTK